MPISRTDVEKIAELARLELTAEETDSFTEQLSSILGYIDKLNEVDTAGVEPMSHSTLGNDAPQFAQRDDEVRSSLGAAVATENAPDKQAGYFKVPKVI
jgi:aspartyl-tRNA(Asn)/glutamyl-tRNA(Gln) amidotransferase subunit C